MADVSIRLTGSADDLVRELGRVEDALKGVDGEVGDVRSELRRLSSEDIDIEIDVDTGKVASDLRDLDAPDVDVEVTADTSRLRSDLGRLDSDGLSVDVTADVSKARRKIRGLDGMEVEVDVTADVDGINSGMGGAGEAGGATFLGGFGRGIGVAGGALAAAAVGVGAIFVHGVTDAMDREQLSDTIEAQLGVDEATAQLLGDVAGGNFAQGFGGSLSEVVSITAGVYQQVADLGTGDPLGPLTAQAMTLTDVFGYDLNEVLLATRSMVTNGLVPDMESAFDVITTGSQNNLNATGDFLDMLWEYSPAFSRLDMDATEVLTGLNAYLDAGGISADKFGDAMNEFSIRSVEDSKDVRQALRSMGLDARELQADIAGGGPAADAAMDTIIAAIGRVEDPVRRQALGVMFFGSMWEDAGGEAILAIGGVDEALGNASGGDHYLANLAAAGDGIDAQFADIEGSAQKLTETVSSNTRTTIDSMWNGWQLDVQPIFDEALTSVDDFIAGDWNDALKGVGSTSQDLTGYYLQTGADIGGWIVGGVTDVVGGGESEVGASLGAAVGRAIDDQAAPSYDGGHGVGSNIMSGMVGGVLSGAQAMIDAVVAQVLRAVIAAREAAQIESPSRVFAKIGEQLMEGMAVGVDKGYEDMAGPAVRRSMDRAAEEGRKGSKRRGPNFDRERARLGDDDLAEARIDLREANRNLSQADVVADRQIARARRQGERAMADADTPKERREAKLAMEKEIREIEKERREAKNQARNDILEAERDVAEAKRDIGRERENLAISQAQAAGDDIEAARLRVEAEKAELAYIKASGAGKAEILAAQGDVVDANARLDAEIKREAERLAREAEQASNDPLGLDGFSPYARPDPVRDIGGRGETIVVLNVEGSIMTEMEITETIRRGLIEVDRRNGTVGFS